MIDKPSIIQHILCHLENILGDIYEDFIEQMRYDNIAISGSSILQIMYGEKWKIGESYSDLDVFIHDDRKDCCGKTHYKFRHEGYIEEKNKVIVEEKENYKITYYYINDVCIYSIDFIDKLTNIEYKNPDHQFLKTYEIEVDGFLHYVKHKNYISPIEAILYKNFAVQISKDIIHHARYNFYKILKIKDYVHRLNNKNVVQIIQIDENISEYINKFDLPIIKNMFYRDFDGNFHLEIAAENDIENRSTTFMTSANFIKSLHRAYKYQHYYNIKINFAFCDEYNILFNRLLLLDPNEYELLFKNMKIYVYDDKIVHTDEKLYEKYYFISYVYQALDLMVYKNEYFEPIIKYIHVQHEKDINLLGNYYKNKFEIPIVGDKPEITNDKFVEKYVKNKPILNSKYGIRVETISANDNISNYCINMRCTDRTCATCIYYEINDLKISRFIKSAK